MRDAGSERKLARKLVVPLVLAVTVTSSIAVLGAGAPGCGKSTPVVDAGHGDANGDTPVV